LRVWLPFSVLTNRGVRALRSPATTALALFSCRVSVALSRTARLREYAHTARHEVGCRAGSHTGSARFFSSFFARAVAVDTRGVMVSMTCPSLKASPYQRKWDARSFGALVTREPTMNRSPASCSCLRLLADSIPASATTTMSASP